MAPISAALSACPSREGPISFLATLSSLPYGTSLAGLSAIHLCGQSLPRSFVKFAAGTRSRCGLLERKAKHCPHRKSRSSYNAWLWQNPGVRLRSAHSTRHPGRGGRFSCSWCTRWQLDAIPPAPAFGRNMSAARAVQVPLTAVK